MGRAIDMENDIQKMQIRLSKAEGAIEDLIKMASKEKNETKKTNNKRAK